jgi:hypothetical protein
VSQYRSFQKRASLDETDSDRLLFLAVPVATLNGIFKERIGQVLIQREGIRLFGFDPLLEVIVEWIP